jgi:regulator of chromosome condensation
MILAEISSFGCNDDAGAVGRDTTDEAQSFAPGKIDAPGKAIQVTAGDSHSAALPEDGKVFAWGNFRAS